MPVELAPTTRMAFFVPRSKDRDMSENRRYWLKLHKQFFEDETIIYLGSLENGDKYVNIWLRLLLLCLKDTEETAGFLRFTRQLPYTDALMAKVLRHDIDTVRCAMEYFHKLDMVETLDDGTLYIEAVQEMIGSESSSYERVQRHRRRKAALHSNGKALHVTHRNVTLSHNKEKEEEKELEEERELEKDQEKDTLSGSGPTAATEKPDRNGKAPRELVEQIVAHLNSATGKAFRPASRKTSSLINARYREGFRFDDFSVVIDTKAREWLGGEMEQYLRPETLFGSHFESYLNQRARASPAPKAACETCGTRLIGGTCPKCDPIGG